ncbi:MAG: HU family DNA-binding protein [Rubrobacter sp.]|nr:HU family DNA-binding protein [Rubrobacter sp.]
MDKAELIEVAEHANSSKGEAQRYLEATLRNTRQALEGGGDVRNTGFGKFLCPRAQGHEGCQPADQNKMRIPVSKEAV